MGASLLWISVLVLLPLAALVARSLDGGLDAFWHAVTTRQAVSALRFTLLISLATAAINSRLRVRAQRVPNSRAMGDRVAIVKATTCSGSRASCRPTCRPIPSPAGSLSPRPRT